MSKTEIEHRVLCLVNLISREVIARHQTALAVNVLADYCTQKVDGLTVEIVDMQVIFDEAYIDLNNVGYAYDVAIKRVIDRIAALHTQYGGIIVGLSMKWGTKSAAEAILKNVRQVVDRSSCLFVLGNIVPTFAHDELVLSPAFDDILFVLGEGEDALVSIIEQSGSKEYDMSNYEGIPNVAQKRDPSPVRSRVDLEEYPASSMQCSSYCYDREGDHFDIETSRGCSWSRCTFCSIRNQFNGSRSTGRSSDWHCFSNHRVLAEIERLAHNGARRFDIKDSDFFGNFRYRLHGAEKFDESMERALRLAEGFAQLNTKFSNTLSIAHVSARVDSVYVEGECERNQQKEALFRRWLDAGLRGIYLGIESGSPSQLKRYCKGSTTAESARAIAILREIGYEVEVGFIFFDPFATLEELSKNIDFIEKTRLYETPSRLFGSLRIQPCTPYFKFAERAGLVGVKDESFQAFACLFEHDVVARTEAMFRSWEAPVRGAIKILTREESQRLYREDFFFMKDLISAMPQGSSEYHRVLREHHEARLQTLLALLGATREDGFRSELLQLACTLSAEAAHDL